VLVETHGRRLLTDPVLGRRVGPLRRVVAPPPADVAGEIDAVLLSHLHADHSDLRSLLRIGRRVPVLAPPPVAGWLRRRGFRQVRQMIPGDVVDLGGVSVKAVPARHEGSRWRGATAKESLGYVIGGESPVLFAGDTDLYPEMSSLAGAITVALLPVWGWGPSVGPGHLDPERAAQAAALIEPRVAIPIHWGTLALPWARQSRAAREAPAREFAHAARRLAPAVEVHIPEPGAPIALDGAGRVVPAPGADACARARTPPPDPP
jgi:L-ascorbate metabolism protein UlaG (beta-lactamase superfamily)